MFTGIVEECGKVEAFEAQESSWRLRVACPVVGEDLRVGDSVAVNGCCLTAVAIEGHAVSFDLLEETRRLTNFSQLAAGSLVNLERALLAGGRLGGHFVTGHIDGLGVVETFERRGADHYLKVRVPAGLGRYLIHKGSIAIDGISLTVAEVSGDHFAVWLIPHTLEVTNLASRRVSECLNLEFDLIGKYVEKLLGDRSE